MRDHKLQQEQQFWEVDKLLLNSRVILCLQYQLRKQMKKAISKIKKIMEHKVTIRLIFHPVH